ncbi:hypothetical protein BJ322DRAFT_1019304 [Thelephora terrestris]|uniref:Uncharacterized protein n=1 Tax=Thelephora terrestris TaxID=56493 RepID=A0A9P6HGJ1_9AGAM|nr:hypothetical protein BJ322DRAFT_1019304 [Thelephora terrestris]
MQTQENRGPGRRRGPRRGREPEPVKSGGSIVRSANNSSTAAPVPSKYYPEEDYDEGVEALLMELASFRNRVPSSQPLLPLPAPSSSGWTSPGPMNFQRGSITSDRGDLDSPTLSPNTRPLCSASEDNGSGDIERPNAEGPKLYPASEQTPASSTRPSPIPFRAQPPPASHEFRQLEADHCGQTSPPPVVLPPQPWPFGNGMVLPPIASISPTSSVSSERDEDAMAVDM